jgi:hypothetical protein
MTALDAEPSPFILGLFQGEPREPGLRQGEAKAAVNPLNLIRIVPA